MKKTTRKIIFFCLAVIFLLLAPTLILYSQGYRWDFDEQELTQTGGLFIKALPRQLNVYVDGKFRKQTDFFFGSALIESLLPKQHQVEVKKKGYHPWKKKMKIEEKQVTEAKNIILFPRDITFNFVQKNIQDLWFSPQGNKTVWLEEGEKEWSLKLYDLERQVKSHLLEETDISQEEVEVNEIKFPQSNNNIYLYTEINEEEKVFTVDITPTPVKIKEKEEEERELPEGIPESRSIISFQEDNGGFYYLDASGTVYRFDNFSQQEEKIAQVSFPIQQGKEYEIEGVSGFLFIQQDSTLYRILPEEETTEKFCDNYKGHKISPDNKKLAYFSDHEIKVFFLEDTLYQPIRKRGENIFLSRLSENIQSLFWIDSDYLLFNTQNGIQIAESDTRDTINIFKIAEFKDSKIQWQPNQDLVYVFSDHSLWFSQKITPY